MKRQRVLIIDDNDLSIQLAAFVLSQAAFEVSAAADAQAGLLLVPVFRPDLILLDIRMSDMDGLKLAKILKPDATTHHIVVVAFTAYAMKCDEGKMRSAGCDGYIAKPIDIGSFAKLVGSYLPV